MQFAKLVQKERKNGDLYGWIEIVVWLTLSYLTCEECGLWAAYGPLVMFIVATRSMTTNDAAQNRGTLGRIQQGQIDRANGDPATLERIVRKITFTNVGIATTAIIIAVVWSYLQHGNITNSKVESITPLTTVPFRFFLGPLLLRVFSKFGWPISATFMTVALYASKDGTTSMLQKTGMAMAWAFVLGLVVWSFKLYLQKGTEAKKESDDEKYRRLLVLEYFVSWFAMVIWFSHDLCNPLVFLSRDLSIFEIVLAVGWILFDAILVMVFGGGMQQYADKTLQKQRISDAIAIDAQYETVLVAAKEIFAVAISTSAVFVTCVATKRLVEAVNAARHRDWELACK